jgi:arylsulfatase A-like enzyme
MIKKLISRIAPYLMAASAFTVQGAENPNVIIILADDMGSDSISAFNDKLGFKTPRIDALAKESMVFSDGHSGSAVCTPTRYGLLTGRYSWRSRLKKGIVPKWDAPLIEEGRMTIASMLSENGYATACIGKWHLGWEWPFESGDEVPIGNGGALGKLAARGVDWKAPVTGGPIDRGFDYHFGDGTINWPPFVYVENDRLLGTPNPDVVNIQLPDNTAEDSSSLLPALLGEKFEREAIVNHSSQGKFAIRSGDWKLIYAPGSAGWGSPKDAEAREMNLPELQLYNLGDDPKETQNLVAEKPELVQSLTKQLHGMISSGRSTVGAPQSNVGETWLPEI